MSCGLTVCPRLVFSCCESGVGQFELCLSVLAPGQTPGCSMLWKRKKLGTILLSVKASNRVTSYSGNANKLGIGEAGNERMWLNLLATA